MLKINPKSSCSALFSVTLRPDFDFFLSGGVSALNRRSRVDAPAGHSPNMLGLCPAGAIFQALDNLFILCYTFSVKKEVPICPKQLDLNQTIESMLKMLNRLLGEDIHLTWSPKGNLWPIRMDPSQIHQLLVNLCVNSRDAVKEGGQISIETDNLRFDADDCRPHEGLRPGEYIMLAVSDNGTGMDEQTMDQLFDPFFTTKGMEQGTGLGLATVYGIVKQNKGYIKVYSEPGKGARFKLYFPRHEQQTITSQAVPDITGGNETILIVEDEPNNLSVSATMLRRLGYTVMTAATPDKALTLAKGNRDKIHLLITDVVMPEMNGKELAKKLTERLPELRSLFMSGYTANIISKQGVLPEGLHFIQKPFSSRNLAVAIRRILDGHRS